MNYLMLLLQKKLTHKKKNYEPTLLYNLNLYSLEAVMLMTVQDTVWKKKNIPIAELLHYKCEMKVINILRIFSTL